MTTTTMEFQTQTMHSRMIHRRVKIQMATIGTFSIVAMPVVFELTDLFADSGESYDTFDAQICISGKHCDGNLLRKLIEYLFSCDFQQILYVSVNILDNATSFCFSIQIWDDDFLLMIF